MTNKQTTIKRRIGLINAQKRRRIGAALKLQLTEVTRPTDVARMLGISKQLVNQITDLALFKIYARMTNI